ncbi:MAG: PD-(D/E)XK nuclease superfamily protein [Syntrophus sp. PtaB.Bin138]|jgi:CRISPR-associated exonuclease Cas4|nr:MAG: PD-(D/E)XK nuclease superfamily protein [Syntrophus sp. PtaB.Bin138]
MSYSEDDLLPLSALQHLLFCERQCALIHVEQTWVENLYTAEGRIMHERVDAGRSESRGDVRVVSGMPLRSLRLGLSGKADVVELHRESGETGEALWRPFPVEYKRGRPKKEAWDKVQLCAQAQCLEEMMQVGVPRGALFYGKTRRRVDVAFDADLRRKTEEAARRLHDLIASGVTPRAHYNEKCESCSFLSFCLPMVTDGSRSAARYLARVFRE